jgi:hypothetical protein
MYLVHELVEIIFVSRAQIDEGLDRLVGVSRNLLSLTSFDSLDGIVNEHGEVSNAVVHVRRLVNANKRFVENGKEVAEELESGRLDRVSFISDNLISPAYLLDDLQHHQLISLSQA